MQNLLLFILTFVLAASGVALLTLGLRGRRVNDHPHCRRCRFDLHGIDTESDGARCPECGVALDQPKSIRIGARRRRPRFIGIGAVALLVAVSIGVPAGWSATTGFNWNTVKPQWMLEAQLERSMTLDDPSIVNEFARRAADGGLASSRLVRLAKIGAESYSGGSRLREAWAELIAEAWNRELIEPENLVEFASRAAVNEVFIPEQSHARPSIQFDMYVTSLPPSASKLSLELWLNPVRVRLGDIDLHPIGLPADSMREGVRIPRGTFAVSFPLEPDAPLQIGEGSVEVNLDFELRQILTDERTTNKSDDTPVARWTQTTHHPIRIRNGR